MFVFLFLQNIAFHPKTDDGYEFGYGAQYYERLINIASISDSCFINIMAKEEDHGGAVYYKDDPQFTVLRTGFFFCNVVNANGGALYIIAKDIEFTLSCAFNCEARGSGKQDGIGQFAHLVAKENGAIVGFHKSTIFGCPGGGTKSFYSNNGLFSSPAYFAVDSSVDASSLSYSSLQYDHSNATHSYINNGPGTVCLKNSKTPHVQYCYILENEIESLNVVHGFIEVSQCSLVAIDSVIFRNNHGSENSLIVFDDVSRGSDFSYIHFALLVNNYYSYFILLKNGCNVGLANVFYWGDKPNAAVGQVSTGSKSNVISFDQTLQNNQMTINYQSSSLNCDGVYFAFTATKKSSNTKSYTSYSELLPSSLDISLITDLHPPQENSDSSSLKSWEISLIVLAPILLVLIGLLLFYIYRKKKCAEKKSDADGEAYPNSVETYENPKSTISQENPLFKAPDAQANVAFEED